MNYDPRPIEYDLKPEYGGVKKRVRYDPDKLYTATHHCGKVLRVYGWFLNEQNPLTCTCSFGRAGHAWRITDE